MCLFIWRYSLRRLTHCGLGISRTVLLFSFFSGSIIVLITTEGRDCFCAVCGSTGWTSHWNKTKQLGGVLEQVRGKNENITYQMFIITAGNQSIAMSARKFSDEWSKVMSLHLKGTCWRLQKDAAVKNICLFSLYLVSWVLEGLWPTVMKNLSAVSCPTYDTGVFCPECNTRLNQRADLTALQANIFFHLLWTEPLQWDGLQLSMKLNGVMAGQHLVMVFVPP